MFWNFNALYNVRYLLYRSLHTVHNIMFINYYNPRTFALNTTLLLYGRYFTIRNIFKYINPVRSVQITDIDCVFKYLLHQ